MCSHVHMCLSIDFEFISFPHLIHWLRTSFNPVVKSDISFIMFLSRSVSLFSSVSLCRSLLLYTHYYPFLLFLSLGELHLYVSVNGSLSYHFRGNSLFPLYVWHFIQKVFSMFYIFIFVCNLYYYARFSYGVWSSPGAYSCHILYTHCCRFPLFLF